MEKTENNLIEVKNVTKVFDSPAMRAPFIALDGLCAGIRPGSVYGLVGANGAGKSTLLRLIAGVYRPDSGEITVGGQPVYDRPQVKEKIVFVPDELYFLPQATMKRMAQMTAALRPSFSRERFEQLIAAFGLDPRASISSFSKGMKRQAATVLALSCMPQILLFDETFDGLDPVMRQVVRRVIYADVAERGMTVIISSHSLREIEDTCDRLALLHRGGIVFETDMDDIRTSLFKVQIAFPEPFTEEKFTGAGLAPLSYRQSGSVANFILRGGRVEAEEKLRAMSPMLCDLLPLTLEEIFLHEAEALGYRVSDFLGEDENENETKEQKN